MIRRLSSFLKAPNKRTLWRYFLREVGSDLRTKFLHPLLSVTGRPVPVDGKLNLSASLYPSYGDHRSGWAFAIKSLKPLHHPAGILFDPFIEKTFAWNPKGTLRPHLQPWVGVIHVPPHVPGWFPGHQSNQSIFSSEAWKTSYPYCKGLFTLSAYHQQALSKTLDIPINNLLHPTDFNVQPWRWDLFNLNPEKKIVQVGWWLRKLYSIYQLPVKKYQKIFLRKDETGMDDILKGELEHTVGSENLSSDQMASTRVMTYLSARKYDRLLSENIVFLDLHDASANNTILECIARNTPVLVNPIEPVKEYLGENYPFYFTSLEEAANKAEDARLVKSAHEYLVHHPFKTHFTGHFFRQSLMNTEIYQSL